MPARRRKPVPTGEFTADIVDLAQDGRGVARIDGKVTFVHGALPGERVRLKLTHVTRDVDEGEVTAIERASPDRVEPGCAHFGLCGGCSLQHLAPPAQLAFKQKALLDALQRLGGVVPEEVAAPVTGPVWAYRRRARMGAKLVPQKGGVLVGFRERASSRLATLDACPVIDARVGAKLLRLRELIGSLSIAGQVPQIEVAAGEQVALVVRVLADPTPADLDALRAFIAEHDFDLYLQRGGPDSLKPLMPPRQLRYSPDGSALQLEFGPADFVQINGELSQKMVRQALAWLAPQAGDTVLELFAGLGNFTAPLAATGAQVTALEGEAALVARGRANLQRNGLDARYHCADLFKPDPRADWLRSRYKLALLDPPRSGAAEMLPHVAASGVERLVYVSCHPGTLARDAGELVRSHGFRLVRAGVLDMFPHTAHVESMALFVRA
ncbi:MAG: 23S rRNA (uracil(1939)-C(5))-methyltransferase RlmD [Nevskia sp.]